MRLVGVAGPAGAGKDAIGNILEDALGWKKFSFSDQLYEEVSAAYDLPEALFRDRELKEQPLWCLALRCCRDFDFTHAMLPDLPDTFGNAELFEPRSPRWVLQRWGTDYRRAQDPMYWVKTANEAIAVGLKHHRYPGMVNVSVRFDNELAWLDRNGGTLIHVTRPGYGVESDYESERPLAVREDDIVIHNDGDLAQLRDAVLSAVETVEDAG